MVYSVKIIAGKIDYDLTKDCRKDELKCGQNGIYFVEDSPLIVKWKSFRNSVYFEGFKSFFTILMLGSIPLLGLACMPRPCY